jgi:hypothetical protein
MFTHKCFMHKVSIYATVTLAIPSALCTHMELPATTIVSVITLRPLHRYPVIHLSLSSQQGQAQSCDRALDGTW